MYKLSVLILFVLGISNKDSKKPERFPVIEKKYPLLWKTKTGAASFRTNVVASGGKIIIGSNGMNFRDYHFFDKGSGVNILSATDGKLLRKLSGEQYGDMDVNGVLVRGDSVYFGNDNEEFQCMTTDGRLIWRRPVSGDVEHEPVELDINGRKAIVFGTEKGEVRAVEPASGRTIWTYYIPDFNGWKPGDNRFVFKVGSFFSDTYAFYTKPVVADLNLDGVMDLVYAANNNHVYALNGKTGKALWVVTSNDRTYIQPYIEVVYDKGIPILLINEYTYVYGNDGISDHYASRTLLSRYGKPIHRQRIESKKSYFGLNGLSMQDGRAIFISSDSAYVLEPGKKTISIDRRLPYWGTDWHGDSSWQLRNSYAPVVSNRTFEHPLYGTCLVIFNPSDALSDHSFIEVVSLTQRKPVQWFELPFRGGEMPPFIGDVNGDGRLEMLVNGYDGYTYCYNLKSSL